VLSNWETEDIYLSWEAEAVNGDIMGGDRLFCEFEFLEYIGIEDLSRFCDEGVSSWLFIRFNLKVCRTVIEDFISPK
jgi:hypothetical protein